MVKEIYGSDFDHNVRIQRIVANLDTNGDGKISLRTSNLLYHGRQSVAVS